MFEYEIPESDHLKTFFINPPLRSHGGRSTTILIQACMFTSFSLSYVQCTPVPRLPSRVFQTWSWCPCACSMSCSCIPRRTCLDGLLSDWVLDYALERTLFGPLWNPEKRTFWQSVASWCTNKWDRFGKSSSSKKGPFLVSPLVCQWMFWWVRRWSVCVCLPSAALSPSLTHPLVLV